MESALRKAARGQGIAAIALAVMWGLVTLLPLVAAAIAGQASVALVLTFCALLLAPLGIGVFGVRQLRRRPRIPEVAVAITPTSVRFPALDRPSGLARRRRADEWAREGTTVEVRPASGLMPTALLVFTRQDGRTRRRRTVSADNLDVDPRIIVDALDRQPSA